jgi:hypothetical protein
MHSIVITLAIVAAILLIDISYVYFRFRHRDGLLWFWMLNPAPHSYGWRARASSEAILVALSAPFVGTTKTFAVDPGVAMALHVVSLILPEVLEPL